MSYSPRLPGVVVDKPFVYGSAAFVREERSDENTHRWTVYLRGMENEDLSTYIKEVHFQLHESFKDPVRVIRSPPYEVTEFGWGEFIITITVHFHPESGEGPVTLQHNLKLFPENKNTIIPKNSPLLIEKYDEFVFFSPTQRFHQLLKLPPPRYFSDHFLQPFYSTEQIRDNEDKFIGKVTSATNVIRADIEALQAKLYETEVQIQNMMIMSHQR